MVWRNQIQDIPHAKQVLDHRAVGHISKQNPNSIVLLKEYSNQIKRILLCFTLKISDDLPPAVHGNKYKNLPTAKQYTETEIP